MFFNKYKKIESRLNEIENKIQMLETGRVGLDSQIKNFILNAISRENGSRELLDSEKSFVAEKFMRISEILCHHDIALDEIRRALKINRYKDLD